MKRLFPWICLAAAGCSLRPNAVGPGPAPDAPPDTRLAREAAPPAAPVQLPARIDLAARYRVIILDGHAVLVRADEPPQAGAADPSLQPAPLAQELAAELAACRESSARMDNALASVMARSEELARQASRLEEQSRRLLDLASAAPDRAKAPAQSAAPGP